MALFFLVGLLLTSAVEAGNEVYNMKMGKGLGKFSWENCNKTAVPLAFRSLSVSPDPIQYGQNLVLSAEVDVTETIGLNGKVEAKITAVLIEGEEKFDMCQYKPSLCSYSDFCYNISQIKMPCPPIVKKLGNDCKCPVKPNKYSVSQLSFNIPNPKVQIQGQFQVQVDMSESNKPIGCFFMNFCLGSCSVED